jgi:putative component of membrane protein insertase Oxa1/YidC/SpoIIIJ protein YidD
MILSIKNYGVVYGVIKGIKRLKRCHLPNGGDDYP